MILKSGDIAPAAKGAALLHICMSLNQPVLLIGIVSGVLAGILDRSLVPLLLTLFAATLAWVLLSATTFLRAGHNFIRGGALPPGRTRTESFDLTSGQPGGCTCCCRVSTGG